MISLGDDVTKISLVESEKYNKQVNKTKEKQTHRYREQTSGVRKGRVARQGQGVYKSYYGIV